MRRRRVPEDNVLAKALLIGGAGVILPTMFPLTRVGGSFCPRTPFVPGRSVPGRSVLGRSVPGRFDPALQDETTEDETTDYETTEGKHVRTHKV